MLNDRSDTSQLLGCFEQRASDIGAFIKEIDYLKKVSANKTIVARLISLEHDLKKCLHDTQAQLSIA